MSDWLFSYFYQMRGVDIQRGGRLAVAQQARYGGYILPCRWQSAGWRWRGGENGRSASLAGHSFSGST